MQEKTSKKEIIIVAAVLLALVCGILLYFVLGKSGTYAIINTNSDEVQILNASGKVVAENKNGKTMKISLSQNGIYTVKGTPIIVTLEIKDNAIRVINSKCPDHICENYGWLRLEAQFATCLPAGVNVVVGE
ncbi:MAG: NusG domain II-containing protein [Oscillospiraceae bacterium]